MEHESNNFGPPAELPQPQEVVGQAIPEEGPAAQPEARGMQAPVAQPRATPDPSQVNVQAVQSIGANPLTSAPVNSTAALIADDADLIEKEWVTKAKAIVTQTRNDPHLQNREINKVKADYLKKRYNKDLKVSEN